MIAKLVALLGLVAVASADYYLAAPPAQYVPTYYSASPAAAPITSVIKEFPAGVLRATHYEAAPAAVPYYSSRAYIPAPLAKEWPAGVDPAAHPFYPYKRSVSPQTQE